MDQIVELYLDLENTCNEYEAKLNPNPWNLAKDLEETNKKYIALQNGAKLIKKEYHATFVKKYANSSIPQIRNVMEKLSKINEELTTAINNNQIMTLQCLLVPELDTRSKTPQRINSVMEYLRIEKQKLNQN